MFLVGIDFEGLRATRCQIGDGLFRQVDSDLRSVVVGNRLEEFLQERLAHDHGKYEVVEFVVLVYIGKERANDNPESIVGNGPCCMFTAGAASEVLAGNKDDSRISRIVEHEVGTGCSIGIVSPVAKQIVAHAYLIGSLEETGRDDLIGVNILQRKRHTR